MFLSVEVEYFVWVISRQYIKWSGDCAFVHSWHPNFPAFNFQSVICCCHVYWMDVCKVVPYLFPRCLVMVETMGRQMWSSSAVGLLSSAPERPLMRSLPRLTETQVPVWFLRSRFVTNQSSSSLLLSFLRNSRFDATLCMLAWKCNLSSSSYPVLISW